MSFKKHSRQYDLVVFGATGYTGALVAEHITTHLPTDLKWAVAGRSAEKLQNVISECRALNPDRRAPDIEICSLNDADLGALAKKTFALITTVGPYAKYGEYAFKACAENGTHYFDCTGEAVWHMSMIKKYEATAKATGACLFPQAGIESAPSDLMTFSMASLLRSTLSAPVGDVVVKIHAIRGAPSGGTLSTVLGLFDVFHWKEVAKSHKPYALSPTTNPKQAPSPSLLSRLIGLYSIPNLGLVSNSVTSGTNRAVVQRTWGLFKREPSLQKHFYGANFTYREFIRAKTPAKGMMMHYGLIFGGLLLMFCPPFRRMLRKYVSQPGEGPSKEAQEKEYIQLQGVATPDIQPNTDKQAWCKAEFSGGMYKLTATFLSEAACSMLQDDTKLSGGVYTPACLGHGYIDRLNDAGFRMETKIIDSQQ
ncbi:Saccharopine dehydrogenase-domain-containing protein [Hypoxylon cercidicola]|nr:Saccharopine dehydrogenase-domain-containing protein [Hypoxylon cercidicola]